MEEFVKALGGLSASLFSPAKMVFMAYILLVWKTATTQAGWKFSPCEFFLVSICFLAIEIGHNDWFRIRLNNHAKKTTVEWERKQ
jgi:hypothetical protein